MTTLGLKNINMLSKEQYDGVAEPAKDELWAIEAVESYHDDEGNWYRVYPDGWCEQGGYYINKFTGTGQATISLLKPLNNTNYGVQVSWTNPGTQSPSTVWTGSLRTRTTSNFVINVDSKSYCLAYSWQVCGYIA